MPALPGWLALVLHLLMPFHALLPTSASAGELTVICTAQGLQTVPLSQDDGDSRPAGPHACSHCTVCAGPGQPVHGHSAASLAAPVHDVERCAKPVTATRSPPSLEQAAPPRAPPAIA